MKRDWNINKSFKKEIDMREKSIPNKKKQKESQTKRPQHFDYEYDTLDDLVPFWELNNEK